MITKIILKEEQNKVCKKKRKKLIFKIPILYFLPIPKNNNSSKFSTYANFGHLKMSKILPISSNQYPNVQNLLFSYRIFLLSVILI